MSCGGNSYTQHWILFGRRRMPNVVDIVVAKQAGRKSFETFARSLRVGEFELYEGIEVIIIE